MRTLSLGVLIVCGGTLAALPFRRIQAIPDASAVPNEVTGPSQSALQSLPGDDSPSTAARVLSLAEMDSLGDIHAQADSIGFATRPAPVTRRQIDIPLTYDDLAVPIDQPKPVMDRFNATAQVQQEKREQDRIAGLVMPPMESLPLAQQQELVSVAKSIAPAVNPPSSRASGRLASSAATDRSGSASSELQPLESLPSKPDAQPQRFWIRQPN